MEVDSKDLVGLFRILFLDLQLSLLATCFGVRLFIRQTFSLYVSESSWISIYAFLLWSNTFNLNAP
ncbi:hypothetical protein, partial [Klebsiella pneumoniae]|uniref:hypothetical protein n=1 Tax=Klebsiella pneumoniae TaxID=573 RepID=UPI001D0E0ECC